MNGKIVACAMIAAAWSFGCGSDDSGGGSGGSAGSAGMAGGGSGGTSGSSGSGGSGGMAGSGAATSPAEDFADVGAPQTGMAFAGDALFVSIAANDEIQRIDSSGNAASFATVPAPRGLAAAADGSLLACGMDSNGEGAIWSISTSGMASVFTDAQGTLKVPNAIAVAPDDRVVFSDSGSGTIYRVDSDGSNLSIVTASIPSPSALAFSSDGTELYVASAGTGTLYSVPRSAAIGNFGPEKQLGSIAEEVGAIALTSDDELVLAARSAGVLHLDSSYAQTVLVSGSDLGEPGPAAFGVGAFSDSNFYLGDVTGTKVQRVPLEEMGVALPIR